MAFLLFDARTLKIESKELFVDTGGIGDVSDIGRWREKKDDIFTSVTGISKRRIETA